MNKYTRILLCALYACFGALQAQTPMGKWHTYFSYNSVNQLTQSANKIFAVSDGALFSLNKDDGSIQTFSKVNGLNGSNIVNLKYNDTSKNLLVIYNDGNMDFLSANGIINLPDYRNKQMSVDKTVNHILFNNEKAYLSCNFGIISLNMDKQEIKDTYYIGNNASEVKVLSTAILKNQLYAASPTDVYVGSLSDPYLVSYEHWKKLSGLPGSGNIQNLTVFAEKLVLQRGGVLYIQGDDEVWRQLDNATQYSKITLAGDYLLALLGGNPVIFNKQLIKTSFQNLSTSIYDGVYEPTTNQFWLAAGNKGLLKYNLTQNTASAPIKPDGPASNTPYKLFFAGKRLFVLQGGRIELYKQDLNPGLVMIFENNNWKNILPEEINTGKPVLDFMDIAVDPNDNKHFVISSYGTGIFEFREDKFYKWHNFINSSIEAIFPDERAFYYMRTDAGIYDDQKNVWFTNSSATKGIKVLKNDGKWLSLGTKDLSGLPTLGTILINKRNKNHKWILSVRVDGGIVFFDDNGTIEDTSDDKSLFFKTFLNTDNGSFIPIRIAYCLIQDKNDVIWVGTDKGPLLFNNSEKAFESGFTPTRIKIPRNDGTNLADYLLENEAVKAIAIDGANRKWLGTEKSGVYLMSQDGQKLIKHFTAENSPLLSNNIMSIAVNQVTGEVFMGTTAGLISYQSDAAQDGEIFGDVHVYPNPVRENFNGTITITGLIDKTNVKITDLAGNLVCQTVSNGSIATWDGKNGDGRKVSTGVYLFLCVSPDGEQSTVAKLLIIN